VEEDQEGSVLSESVAGNENVSSRRR